jgi:hypothetical protein
MEEEIVSDDLVAWLRAQLDEDERLAKAAAVDGGPDWAPDGTFLADLIDPLPSQRRAHPERIFLLTQEDADHIARHDPARVLREVEAKRRIIDAYEEACERVRNPVTADNRAAARIAQFELEGVVRLLAAAYADRPGYRAEWRP